MPDIYVGHSNIESKGFRLKAFEKITRMILPEMLEIGMTAIDGDEKIVLYVPVQQSDLMPYANNSTPGIDVPHRYLHPPTTNGAAYMQKVPKARIAIHRLAVTGDPMHITWYFWTSIDNWRPIGSTVPATWTPLDGLAYATETVETIEPIPDSTWSLPALAPLPGSFNNMTGPNRLKTLVRRA